MNIYILIKKQDNEKKFMIEFHGVAMKYLINYVLV